MHFITKYIINSHAAVAEHLVAESSRRPIVQLLRKHGRFRWEWGPCHSYHFDYQIILVVRNCA